MGPAKDKHHALTNEFKLNVRAVIVPGPYACLQDHDENTCKVLKESQGTYYFSGGGKMEHQILSPSLFFRKVENNTWNSYLTKFIQGQMFHRNMTIILNITIY